MISTVRMRAMVLMLVWALLFPLLGVAQVAHITDREAAAHVGESVTVEGRVINVHTSRKGHTYINFGAPYPRQDFTAVVFASSANAFKDLAGLSGKRVRVMGVVRLYEGKPEVILDSASQLKVLD